MGKTCFKQDSIELLPRWRLMCGRAVALGPGRVELLEFINATGSLRAAAGQMGMSYMRAWKLVKDTNRWFRAPVVKVVRGGKAGGGARLTETGREAVDLYRRLEQQSRTAVRSTCRRLSKLLAP